MIAGMIGPVINLTITLETGVYRLGKYPLYRKNNLEENTKDNDSEDHVEVAKVEIRMDGKEELQRYL